MAARASAADPVKSALQVVAATASAQLQAVTQDAPAPSGAAEPTVAPRPSQSSTPDVLLTQTTETIAGAVPHEPSTTGGDVAITSGTSQNAGADPNPSSPRRDGLAVVHRVRHVASSLARAPGEGRSNTATRELAATGLRVDRELAASPTVTKATGAIQSTARQAVALAAPTSPLGRAQAVLGVLAQTHRALAELAAIGPGVTHELMRPLSAAGPNPLIEGPMGTTRVADGPKPLSPLGLVLATAIQARQALRTAPQDLGGEPSAQTPTLVASAMTESASSFEPVRSAGRAAATRVSATAPWLAHSAQSTSASRYAQTAGSPPAGPATARTPEPPSPDGVSPAAAGPGTGPSTPIFLMLAGLLLLAATRGKRELRLASEPWRVARFDLILERPG